MRQVANYARLFANPLTAARRGYIDDVIEPEVCAPPANSQHLSLPLNHHRPLLASLSPTSIFSHF